jgi:hypothetical protein
VDFEIASSIWVLDEPYLSLSHAGRIMTEQLQEMERTQDKSGRRSR